MSHEGYILNAVEMNLDIGERYEKSFPLKKTLPPPLVDLRKDFGDCYNQGSLGSCVSNSIAGCIRYVTRKHGQGSYNSSRIFNYYCARQLYWDVNKDSGSTPSAAAQAILSFGLCDEKLISYDISKFAEKPSDAVYKDAATKNLSYYRIDNSNIINIKQCLADGYPIAFCVYLYDNFKTSNGVIPDPVGNKKGGHAMVLIGYDDVKQHFIVANSWGNFGGMNGFLYMSYKYVLSGWDFVTIRSFDKVTLPPVLSGKKDTASLFNNPGYKDNEVEVVVGEYNDLRKANVQLNTVESLRVPSGYSAILYSDLNFGGDMLKVDTNIRYMGSFGNKAKSMKLIKNPEPKPKPEVKPVVPVVPEVLPSTCTQLFSNKDNKVDNKNSIRSFNGIYSLTLTSNGSLIITNRIDNKIKYIFNSNLPVDNYRLSVQDDCNVVIYNSLNKPIWANNNYKKTTGKFNLELCSDGVAIQNSNLGVIWSC